MRVNSLSVSSEKYTSPIRFILLLSMVVLMAVPLPVLAQETVTVSTFAGQVGVTGSANGQGTAATFNLPFDLATDADGNVYVVDLVNSLIRKITPDGTVSTFAGQGLALTFGRPIGIAVDASGNVYVTDEIRQVVHKITQGGVASIFAGQVNVLGSDDGPGDQASFDSPQGIDVDSAGNIFVGSLRNRVVRKITPEAVVSTFAGVAGGIGSADGQGTAASFSRPLDVAVDAAGNVYVVDESNNHLVRKITPGGLVTTIAGQVGTSGGADGQGSAASFASPKGIAVDAAGTIYVVDATHSIRRVTPGGLVTTIAGQPGIGGSGSTDGEGLAASFGNPVGITIDPNGTIYVAERDNHIIRKVVITGPPSEMKLHSVFVEPGATDPGVDITLTNNHNLPIAGLQYSVDLSLDTDAIVTLDKSDADGDSIADLFDPSMLPAGFEAQAVVENDVLKVVIFSPTAATIPADGNPVNVGKIRFTAASLTPTGPVLPATDLLAKVKALNLIDDDFLVIGDENQVSVENVTLENGEIQVGILGDLAGSPSGNGSVPDGTVNILDIISLIKTIINESIPPSGSVLFNISNAAAGSDPETINVADVIALVNIILDVTPSQVKAVAAGPVDASLGQPIMLTDGSMAIPVVLDGQGTAGIQATFTFDAALLHVGTPVLRSEADGVMIDSRIEDGALRLIALNLTGQTLTSGQTVLIPVTPLTDSEGYLTLTDLAVAGVHAQIMPVQLGTVIQSVSGKGASGPASFSLSAASPNPFNPTTTISYEVPQSAHIQLVIYNLLGQEVVRLVDQVQNAGRYEVTWHAVNAQGADVSSGVYLCRLISSTGFSDSRRMTLLK